MIIFKPMGGDSITTACQESTEVARRTRQTVRFNFNDVEMRAVSGTTPAQLEKLWWSRFRISAEEYRNSEESRIAREDWRLGLQGYQRVVDEGLLMLPSVLGVPLIVPLLEWLKVFGNAAGWRGIQYDKSALVDALESAGYIENEFVGNDPEWFSTRERMGRYVVGRFLNGLKTRGCWPDILMHFCEKALEKPE